jgi:hypothetical protein
MSPKKTLAWFVVGLCSLIIVFGYIKMVYDLYFEDDPVIFWGILLLTIIGPALMWAISVLADI